MTLKLHDTTIPKQGFLIYDNDKWSCRPGRKKDSEKKITSSPSMTSSTLLLISLIPHNYRKDGYISTRFKICKKYTPPLPKLSVVSSSPTPPTQPTSRTLPLDIIFKETQWNPQIMSLPLIYPQQSRRNH